MTTTAAAGGSIIAAAARLIAALPLVLMPLLQVHQPSVSMVALVHLLGHPWSRCAAGGSVVDHHRSGHS